MEAKLNDSEIIDVTDDIELSDEELELWQKQIDIADSETINQLISLKITSGQKAALEEICKRQNISFQDYLYKIFSLELIKDYEAINPVKKESAA